ncbi:MAG TPA: prohibitin family protein [Candidatus Nanoarchaeia archaeon]|nr:prohibitin family protein [Candidatus Nanoarchaeia archaeon]
MTLAIFSILIFLAGVILVVIGIVMKKKEVEGGDGAKIGGIACIIVSVVFFIIACATIVPGAHVGVKVTFGKISPTSLPEGLHFINPFANVEKMTLRTQAYTMSIAPGEGQKQGDDSIDILTGDQVQVKIDITVLYIMMPNKGVEVYREFGTREAYNQNIIRPAIRTAIRDSAAQFTFTNLVSKDRDNFQKEIFNKLATSFTPKNFTCAEVMIRNIAPPQAILDAINAKMKQQQEAEQMEFTLQKEKKEKERKIIEAEGISESQKIIRGTLTPSYLQWYFIQAMREIVNSPNNSTLMLPYDSKMVPTFDMLRYMESVTPATEKK